MNVHEYTIEEIRGFDPAKLICTTSKIDLFKVLGVTENATLSDVERAYREKAKRAHPDRGGNTDLMQIYNAAYAVLKDRTGRSIHKTRLNCSKIEPKINMNWSGDPRRITQWYTHRNGKQVDLSKRVRVGVTVKTLYCGGIVNSVIPKSIMCPRCETCKQCTCMPMLPSGFRNLSVVVQPGTLPMDGLHLANKIERSSPMRPQVQSFGITTPLSLSSKEDSGDVSSESFGLAVMESDEESQVWSIDPGHFAGPKQAPTLVHVMNDADAGEFRIKHLDGRVTTHNMTRYRQKVVRTRREGSWLSVEIPGEGFPVKPSPTAPRGALMVLFPVSDGESEVSDRNELSEFLSKASTARSIQRRRQTPTGVRRNRKNAKKADKMKGENEEENDDGYESDTSTQEYSLNPSGVLAQQVKKVRRLGRIFAGMFRVRAGVATGVASATQ